MTSPGRPPSLYDDETMTEVVERSPRSPRRVEALLTELALLDLVDVVGPYGLTPTARHSCSNSAAARGSSYSSAQLWLLRARRAASSKLSGGRL